MHVVRPLRRLLASIAFVAAILAAAPGPAEARGHAKVEWKRVDVPSGEDSERIARMLRKLLTEASRKADFGKADRVVLDARVAELAWEDRGDVVRFSCTVVGRLEGGPSARSRISFGASPKDRQSLEKQVLTLVAKGVVARLAEIARTRP